MPRTATRKPASKAPKSPPTPKEGKKADIALLLKNAPVKKFPIDVKPMLAKLAAAPFESEEWLYEVKWDGYRAMAFMNGKTKAYNNLSFNWAYLLTDQKILYFSVSNVLGAKNVYGYDYANTLNDHGTFDRKAVVPTAERFFFVGFFWTISQDKKSNQLKNL